MQYHALSLAKEGFDVDVVGYSGSEPIPELREQRNVHFSYMSPSPVAFLPFRVLWQFCTLLAALFFKPKSDFVLLQNPPAVPAMIVCWFYCFCMNSCFIVDWHNYGYTILALTLGEKHLLVRIYKWIEFYFGAKASAHLCVTKAMREDLKKKWDISATTLYDRPPDIFRPISVKEEHELFLRLGVDFEDFRSGLEVTRFTRATSDGQYELRDDRPGLLVSSTSWTEDEDFRILLLALQAYETKRSTGKSGLPPLICVITGKGPMKHTYCNIIASKKWRHVQVITPWLQPQDYPRLLASADLGVCLHMEDQQTAAADSSRQPGATPCRPCAAPPLPSPSPARWQHCTCRRSAPPVRSQRQRFLILAWNRSFRTLLIYFVRTTKFSFRLLNESLVKWQKNK